MNINNHLITILNNATGLKVSPDEYDGKDEKYIIFTYTDERPVSYGDNAPIGDIAYLQIQLVTPKKFNYMGLKHIIRDTLEENDFCVTSIRSMLGDSIQGTEHIRQTIFEVNYTVGR